MSGALLRHTWRTQRVKLAFVSLALVVWGSLLPFIYARFGSRFKSLFDSGLVPPQFARIGSGDIFTLPGAVALSFMHPIAMILTSVFAVGFSAFAIAGERQRGTLEVVLARPLARTSFYLTLLAASFGLVAITVATLLAGNIVGAMLAGVLNDMPLGRMPLLWANGVLLFGSIAAIGLAASSSFDRAAPALGWTLGIVVVMYVLEVLGSLWPDAEFLQPYSLFHYLNARSILTGSVRPFDFALLLAVIGAAMAWAIVVFPRRDLAAPM
jgi:ABC-2 type transport system permease protein